jgi:hypothetical protein
MSGEIYFFSAVQTTGKNILTIRVLKKNQSPSELHSPNIYFLIQNTCLTSSSSECSETFKNALPKCSGHFWQKSVLLFQSPHETDTFFRQDGFDWTGTIRNNPVLSGTASAAAVDALDNLSLLHLGLGHPADAHRPEVGVPGLDAPEAAEVLIAL